MSLKTARTFAKTFNGDLEKTATHLRGAGASTNSIRVAMAALQVEAKGVNKETGEAAGKADSFTKSLKDGSLAAGLVKNALAAVAKQLEDLNELAGVDSSKEGIKKSLDLDKKFNKFAGQIEVTGPEEEARLKENVRRISIKTNQSQETVLDAALGIQETKSAGREYLLDNGGRGLEALLKHSYGDNQDAAESVLSAQAAVVGAKDLQLSASDVAEGQNILAAGEKFGSLTGKGVQTKFGGVGANLSALRKTSGLGALRETSAFAQVLGDVPGLSGNIDRVKVIGENLVGKLADTKTQERLKDVAGIDSFKGGKLRPIADIAEDVSKFRAKDPRNEQKLYDVFRDIQARQGILGLSTPERVAKLRELENVDAYEGSKAITSRFVKRSFSLEGKLTAQQREREAQEYDKLSGRAGKLLEVGRVSQQLHESPVLGFVADKGAELAQKGDVRSLLGGAAVFAASIAGSYLLSNDPKNPYKYEGAQREALIDAQKLGSGVGSQDSQTNAQILAIQAAAAKSGVNLDLSGNNPTITSTNDKGVKVQVEIKVDQDGKISEVTSESKDTKSAAKGNTRKKTSTQR